MFTEERHKKIIKILENEQRITTKELSQRLNVSLDSIRRDFITLENQGLIQRTHGGAILKQQSIIMPPNANERYTNIADTTFAIGKAATKYIKENDTIFIGGSSVHFAMLQYLPVDIPYTIITNSIVIAEQIKTMDNIELIIIGGTVKASGNITDALALTLINQFQFDICFITCGGFNGETLSTSTIEVSLLTKAIISKSKKKIALIPYNKTNRVLFSKIVSIEEVDTLIVDTKVKPNILSKISSEIELIIAK